MNGGPVEFGKEGVDIGAYNPDDPLVIEWLCEPMPNPEELWYWYPSYYLLVFSFIEEEEGGEEYFVQDQLCRFLPLELRFGRYGYGGYDGGLSASDVRDLLVCYGLMEADKEYTHQPDLPEYKYAVHDDYYNFGNIVGGVNLEYEDLRLEGANPLFFQRYYNSLDGYIQKDGVSIARDLNQGLGYLGWSHNFDYRIYADVYVDVEYHTN
jgi:hypothetical protein